jgi:hypothetical protein
MGAWVRTRSFVRLAAGLRETRTSYAARCRGARSFTLCACESGTSAGARLLRERARPATSRRKEPLMSNYKVNKVTLALAIESSTSMPNSSCAICQQPARRAARARRVLVSADDSFGRIGCQHTLDPAIELRFARARDAKFRCLTQLTEPERQQLAQSLGLTLGFALGSTSGFTFCCPSFC